MFSNSKKKEVERLKKEGYKKIYVVDCYITDLTAQASTWLWFAYSDLKNAKIWPALCEDFTKTFKRDFENLSDNYKKEGYYMAYKYRDNSQFGHEMLERFKITVA